MTHALFYYTNNKNDDPLDETEIWNNGIIKSKTLHLQGVYINCQKLMSLL